MIGVISTSVLSALSLLSIAFGMVLYRRYRNSQGHADVIGRRAGIAAVVAGIVIDPWSVALATRYASVHALMTVIVALALALMVSGSLLFRVSGRIDERGRWARLALRGVWGLVFVQDILLWLSFQGFFVRDAERAPALLGVVMFAQTAVGVATVYVLSGDGRPSLGFIKQVFVSWSSAMVVMSLGMSLGLSGLWFGFYKSQGRSLSVIADQQIAAAIFVIFGGAPWFILGALRMKLWLEHEEEDRGGGIELPVQRLGRSVRSNRGVTRGMAVKGRR
ncbi:MAG: hypothetical protein ACYDHP_01670 [Ferrimicrobium sp.]